MEVLDVMVCKFKTCPDMYRVTIQVVTNLPLTPKQMLRLKYMLLILKRNLCSDVNRMLDTTWMVTLYVTSVAQFCQCKISHICWLIYFAKQTSLLEERVLGLRAAHPRARYKNCPKIGRHAVGQVLARGPVQSCSPVPSFLRVRPGGAGHKSYQTRPPSHSKLGHFTHKNFLLQVIMVALFHLLDESIG